MASTVASPARLNATTSGSPSSPQTNNTKVDESNATTTNMSAAQQEQDYFSSIGRSKEPAVVAAEKLMSLLSRNIGMDEVMGSLDAAITFISPMAYYRGRPVVKAWIQFEAKMLIPFHPYIRIKDIVAEDEMKCAVVRWSIGGLHFTDRIQLSSLLQYQTITRSMVRGYRSLDDKLIAEEVLRLWTGPHFANHCEPKQGTIDNATLVLPTLDFSHLRLRDYKQLLTAQPSGASTARPINDMNVVYHFMSDGLVKAQIESEKRTTTMAVAPVAANDGNTINTTAAPVEAVVTPTAATGAGNPTTTTTAAPAAVVVTAGANATLSPTDTHSIDTENIRNEATKTVNTTTTNNTIFNTNTTAANGAAEGNVAPPAIAPSAAAAETPSATDKPAGGSEGTGSAVATTTNTTITPTATTSVLDSDIAAPPTGTSLPPTTNTTITAATTATTAKPAFTINLAAKPFVPGGGAAAGTTTTAGATTIKAITADSLSAKPFVPSATAAADGAAQKDTTTTTSGFSLSAKPFTPAPAYGSAAVGSLYGGMYGGAYGIPMHQQQPNNRAATKAEAKAARRAAKALKAEAMAAKGLTAQGVYVPALAERLKSNASAVGAAISGSGIVSNSTQAIMALTKAAHKEMRSAAKAATGNGTTADGTSNGSGGASQQQQQQTATSIISAEVIASRTAAAPYLIPLLLSGATASTRATREALPSAADTVAVGAPRVPTPAAGAGAAGGSAATAIAAATTTPPASPDELAPTPNTAVQLLTPAMVRMTMQLAVAAAKKKAARLRATENQ